MSAGVLDAQDVLAALTQAAAGSRPPIAARVLFSALPTIPTQLTDHTGSRAFRDAVNAALPAGWQLTRRDIASAVVWLRLYGLMGGGKR